MNKIKPIVMCIVAIVMMSIVMSMTASAYVPSELRTAPQMSELEIVKVALAEHDAGRDTNWVRYTLEEATLKNTNGWNTRDNYRQLRQWVAKIESQKPPFVYRWIEPINGVGWAGPGSN